MTELPHHPHIQHANVGITSVYLQGIDSSEIISTVHGRRSPTISATAGLQLRR
jgi:integrase/recombinase XerD